MQCLLVGNFGVGNLGDEALKEYFLKAFPSVDWVILSAAPATGELPRLPLGIRSFFRFDWLKTLRAYRQCDAVVFGGGSLLTDVESPLACVLWWWHTVPARLLGKPIHFAFQGVGPFHTTVGQLFAAMALRSATSISVRDKQSFLRANKLVKNTKIIQTCDPVIWLIEKEKLQLSTNNILILIPRKNSSEKFTKAAKKIIESSSWGEVVVLSMEPDHPGEQSYVAMLSAKVGATSVEVRSLAELLRHVATCKTVVSERYHGALPAKCYGKELSIISQARGDKLSTLMCEMPDTHTVDLAAKSLRKALSIE